MPLPVHAPEQLTTRNGTLTTASRLFFQALTTLLRGAPGLAVVMWGAGSPEGVVTAPPGSSYYNTAGGAGTTLYVKESGTGAAGWVGK